MCGRFAQFSSRDEHLQALGINGETIAYDPQPLDRYNVAPGTRVLILSEREGGFALDPVLWGYSPEWWTKSPLINARSETAASGKMFSKLWQKGRAIVPADGWYEWNKVGSRKQPYFIYRRDSRPLLMAALGHAPFDADHGGEGFVILTAASDEGLLDIHDRRPVVLDADAALEWLHAGTSAGNAEHIIAGAALPETAFSWHPVAAGIGNLRNQGEQLISPVENPLA